MYDKMLFSSSMDIFHVSWLFFFQFYDLIKSKNKKGKKKERKKKNIQLLSST